MLVGLRRDIPDSFQLYLPIRLDIYGNSMILGEFTISAWCLMKTGFEVDQNLRGEARPETVAALVRGVNTTGAALSASAALWLCRRS